MITKIRNVAAPKVKEDSSVAPRMLKISLTDGIMTCHAVEINSCNRLSLKTPPGTKIKLKGENLDVANGFIKLCEKSFEVLGGKVDTLIEKWNVSQSLEEFTRSGLIGTSGEGPPRWIPFGQKNSVPKSDSSTKNVKTIVPKELDEKENAEFESQRLEAIQEAAKGEQKKFGGGTKNIVDSKTKREQERFKREKSESVEKGDGVEDIGRGDEKGRG